MKHTDVSVSITFGTDLMTKRLRQDFERDSIMSPFCYFGSILECSPEMFIMCVLFVNPIQSCSGLTPVCSDTTLCHLLVLSKTGTCFSQSGTFSSRRHPINLGINSLACATMVMLTEWRLPCHFRFVPRRESIHAVCCLADLPELAHWHLQKKKIYADQSICMSGSDNKTWPAEMRHGVRSTEEGHNCCLRWSSGK